MKFQAVIFVFLFMSFNSFSQWEQQESNTLNDLKDVHFLNDSIGFVVGNEGVFLKTNDRGQNWNTSVINYDDDLKAVFAINQDTLFAGGDNLYKTTDGGQSWAFISSEFDIVDIKFFSSQVGFIKSKWLDPCFEFPNVTITLMKYFGTTDGGNTWQNYTQLPNNFISGEIDIVSADTGYLVTNMTSWDYSGGPCQTITYPWFYKTTDGGQNWQEIHDGIGSGIYVGADFLSGWEGYVVKDLNYTYDNGLYRMNAGGSTFTYVSNMPDFLSGSLTFASLHTGYYCIAGDIMKTKTGGIFWASDYDGSTELSDIIITPNYEAFAIGKSGIVLHQKLDSVNVPDPIYWIYCNQNSLSFPMTNIGEQPVKNFTLSSTGNMDLTVDIISPNGFTVKTEGGSEYLSEITGLLIPANHDTVISVRFSPEISLYYSDILTINSNATNFPILELSLSGRGACFVPQVINYDTVLCYDSVWVKEKFTVEQGASLTLCPGTVVVIPWLTIKKEVDIKINGSLYAIGTMEDSILFIVDRAGFKWDGISIEGDNPTDSVILKYCRIENSYKDFWPEMSNGGAIAITGGKYVSITNSTFHHCHAKDNGGGIYWSGCDGNIDNCNFYSCNAKEGGGIFYTGTNDLAISNCTINNCWAVNSGGGIYADTSGPSSIEGCSILDCSAEEGGGLYIKQSSQLSLVNCNINACNSVRKGGGIAMISSPDNEIKFCNISQNVVSEGHGAGIYCESSSPLISNSLITYNRTLSGGSGGGLWGKICSPVIKSCKFYQNESDSAGGGIFLDIMESDKTTKLIQNLFSHNTSRFGGGGIYIGRSKADIILNTITRNHTYWQTAGGIYCGQPLTTRLLGNIIYINGSVEIISEDTAKTFMSYCNIQDGWQGPGENNIDLDPMFYGAEINPWYDLNIDFSIMPGSPCIDAAFPDTTNLGIPMFDIAGNPRFVGDRMDIGAYENSFIYQSIDNGFCQEKPFSISAEPYGPAPDYCTWTFNGELIPGADSTTLELSNPDDEDEGYYQCTLYRSEEVLYSRTIYLYNAGFAPQLDEQPVGAILNLGDQYTLEFKIHSTDYYTKYQWYFDDTIIQGAIYWWFVIVDFSKAKEGRYKCLVENSCGELISDEALVLLSPSAIQEFDPDWFSVSPNPASWQLAVGSRQLAVGGHQSAVSIEVYNLFGQSVAKYKNILSFPYTINISCLSPGMYLLRIVEEDGLETSIKFLKVSR
jgi:photosystem II stability/assembly factor-like uncharacterized protein